MTMCSVHSLHAQPNPHSYPIPGFFPIAGAERKMEAGIFPNAAPEILKKFMPEGGAPANTLSFCLAIPYTREVVLFDTGLGDATWLKSFDAFPAGEAPNDKITPDPVKLILLTHLHGDHIGGLLKGDERRFPNAKVMCSKPEHDGTPPAQLAKIKAAYGDDFSTFDFDDVVFKSKFPAQVTIKALDASGHTPGHTVFLVEHLERPDGGKIKNLILGDLLHAVALQFPAPEVCARYDSDPVKAVAARKRILDIAAQEKIPVRGMHFPDPYVGTVEKNEQGGYAFKTSE